MDHLKFILLRLWRYLNIYFLKPHDAINDTLTASLIHRLDWSGNLIEIGSGDGMFSFIMHGGKFPLYFDRYLLTDTSKLDIFDTHKEGVLPAVNFLSEPTIKLAVDAKLTHVEKIKEIGFAQDAINSEYESLPLPSNAVNKIFYYTPHGLKSHVNAIGEAFRVLKPGGKMLILLYDSEFRSSFIFYRLSKFFTGKFGKYCLSLDNGRFNEITALSKSPKEWRQFFERVGFEIEEQYSGLSCFAWKCYDVQTRPFLRGLIGFFGFLPPWLRTLVKLVWMIVWYPYLIIFYFIFSNEYIKIDKRNCYLAYQLRKIDA